MIIYCIPLSCGSISEASTSHLVAKMVYDCRITSEYYLGVFLGQRTYEFTVNVIGLHTTWKYWKRTLELGRVTAHQAADHVQLAEPVPLYEYA